MAEDDAEDVSPSQRVPSSSTTRGSVVVATTLLGGLACLLGLGALLAPRNALHHLARRLAARVLRRGAAAVWRRHLLVLQRRRARAGRARWEEDRTAEPAGPYRREPAAWTPAGATARERPAAQPQQQEPHPNTAEPVVSETSWSVKQELLASDQKPPPLFRRPDGRRGSGIRRGATARRSGSCEPVIRGVANLQGDERRARLLVRCILGRGI